MFFLDWRISLGYVGQARGRLTQRESAILTRWKSTVRICQRPYIPVSSRQRSYGYVCPLVRQSELTGIAVRKPAIASKRTAIFFDLAAHRFL